MIERNSLSVDDYIYIYMCVCVCACVGDINKEPLHKGSIHSTCYYDYYINLSNYKLTEYQKEFLNLAPNCHLYNKYNQYVKKKKAEIEVFYENNEKLQKQNQIKTHPGIKHILKTEAIKNQKITTILNNNLKSIIKQSQNHFDIC